MLRSPSQAVTSYLGLLKNERRTAMKVLVTGATGRVGGATLKALLDRGADVRALVRKQDDAKKLPSAVETVVGDLSDPPSTVAALRGVDKLFLVIANVADEFTQAITTFDLARRSGVKHVTYLSVLQADQFLNVPHFASKAAVEKTLKTFDTPFSVIRPAYFIQNDRGLKDPLTGPGVYPVPMGDKGISMADMTDIAEASATTLVQPGHEGRTYDVASGEVLTGTSVAQLWSKLLGKTVKYAGHGDFDAFEAQLRQRGQPSWLAHDIRVMFEGYAAKGFIAPESSVTELTRVLGRKPKTYQAFAESMATEWEHAYARV
jgi:uncharacterized protein YbjT (DUF2867 family)